MPLAYARFASVVIITVSILALFAMSSTEELKQEAAADLLYIPKASISSTSMPYNSSGLGTVTSAVFRLSPPSSRCPKQTDLPHPQTHNPASNRRHTHRKPHPQTPLLPSRAVLLRQPRTLTATRHPCSFISCNDTPTGSNTMLLLTDLKETYLVPGELHAELSSPQVYAALDWLAGFHAFRASDFDRASLCNPLSSIFASIVAIKICAAGTYG
ncbi:hypothetical protein R3P38DRAFT_1649102 [Favolaschia claudopus]|uniref:Uncharacterized protein n=1 Tax=Favolaschia claudopus TaxID=2862362 RepID=A0AAW0DLD2_9AGAR